MERVKKKKIFLHDTDALGYVYYAKPLEWFEEIRMELLSRIKPLQEWIKDGYSFMPRGVDISYNRPIKLNDTVSIVTTTTINRASIDLIHRVLIENAIHIDCKITIICLKDGRLSRIPKEIKEYETEQ